MKINKKILSVMFVIGTIFVFAYSDVLFRNKTLTTGIITDGVMGRIVSSNFIQPNLLNAGNIIDRGGSAWQDEPLTITVSNNYKKFQLPLWNANQGFGRPLGADMMSGAFSIIKIPLFLFPSSFSFDIYIILRLFIGALGMYLFLSNKNLNNLSSIIGGIIYVFSGYFVYFINMGHISVEVFIPWLLYSIDLLIKKTTIRNIIFVSVIIVFMLSGGHPESMILALIFAIFYGIISMSGNNGDIKLSFRKYLKIILNIGISGFVAFCILGFFIIPFLQFFLFSDTGYHNQMSKLYSQFLPFKNMIVQFFPFFIRSSIETKIFNYFSIFTLILSIFGLFNKKYRKLFFIFLTFFLLLISKVYGIVSFDWLKYIPILNIFVYYKYLQPEISLSLAVMSAIGFEYIQTEKISKKPLILIGIIYTVLFYFFTKYYQTLVLNLSTKRIIMTVLELLIFILIIYSRKYFKRNNLLFVKIIPIFLFIIIILEILFITPKSIVPRSNPYSPPPFISYLKSLEIPYRVYSPDSLLYPSTSSIFDINDIRDLHAVYTRDYMAYIRNYIDASVIDRFSDYNPSTMINNNQFFNLGNVKYILVTKENSNFFYEVYQTQYKLIYDKEIRIYENLKTLPRAFIVSNIVKAANEKQSIQIMKDPIFDSSLSAVIIDDDSTLVAIPSNPDINKLDNEISFLKYENQLVLIKTKTKKNGYLILTDSFYPGWNVYIDNKKSKIFQADLAFRAVYLPKGTHSVSFKYEPITYLLGGLLSLISIGFILFIFIFKRLKFTKKRIN